MLNKILRTFVTEDYYYGYEDDELGMRISRDRQIRFARKCGLEAKAIDKDRWKMRGNRFQFIRYYLGGPGTYQAMDRVRLFMSRNPK